jgi:hypothetical protein
MRLKQILQLIRRHACFISEKSRIPTILANKKKKKKEITNAEGVMPGGLQVGFSLSYSFALTRKRFKHVVYRDCSQVIGQTHD